MMNGWKTYLGIALALAPTVAHLFGYNLSATFDADVSALADTWVQIVGLAVAAYGRTVATAPGLLAKQ